MAQDHVEDMIEEELSVFRMPKTELTSVELFSEYRDLLGNPRCCYQECVLSNADGIEIRFRQNIDPMWEEALSSPLEISHFGQVVYRAPPTVRPTCS